MWLDVQRWAVKRGRNAKRQVAKAGKYVKRAMTKAGAAVSREADARRESLANSIESAQEEGKRRLAKRGESVAEVVHLFEAATDRDASVLPGFRRFLQGNKYTCGAESTRM